MSLIIHQILDQDHLAVWEMSESIDYFLEKMPLYPHETEEMDKMNDKRKLEYLASRYCLHLISNRTTRGAVTKDSHGKPRLENSNFHISMSHSENYAAIFASPFHCGIDIQKRTKKVELVHHKFIADEELNLIEHLDKEEALHLIWGTKESMYKAYGKREIDFKKHLIIDEVQWRNQAGKIKAHLTKGNLTMKFDVKALLINEYFLVYAKEAARILDAC